LFFIIIGAQDNILYTKHFTTFLGKLFLQHNVINVLLNITLQHMQHLTLQHFLESYFFSTMSINGSINIVCWD